MREKLVLSAIGCDRVGLIEVISRYVVESECNIEESQMSVLCGEIASIFVISGTQEGISRLEGRCKELEEESGLRVLTRRFREGCKIGRGSRYRLRACSLDHPGIVNRLTRELSECGVNIEGMKTKQYYAPTSGAPMFSFEAEVSISGDMEFLRGRFEEIGEEENIDIELQE